MSRLCFVLLFIVVVVVTLSDARPHKCEQRELSLADLELAEDALNRAKQLYPNCEEKNESSISSECSKKDKSLGFISVALDLVSNAKKNIPICPHVPTEEPVTTTEEPVTTTEKHVTTTEKHVTTTDEPVTTTDEPVTTKKDIRALDCQDLQDAGQVTSGVYSVWPRGFKSAVRVRCDMDTDGGGWTVIQRRGNFSEQENFDRNWQDYKYGFGNLERDFWLGNANISALTNQGNYSLRMDMVATDGESVYALFQEFRMGDENSNYRLHVDGYSGTAGDSMTYTNGEMFTTKDKNNGYVARNCAEEMRGGFWYRWCARCNPNGLYMPGEHDEASMHYSAFKEDVGLFSMEMKIKRL